jgi:hypothetical protein
LGEGIPPHPRFEKICADNQIERPENILKIRAFLFVFWHRFGHSD